jgi:class 3 adenylate cyclase
MFGAIARERAAYLNSFGVVPSFRVGLHGGNVIVSEQGDAKRSIGIYGDPINIAARMEDAARRHGVPCVLSQTLADALQDQSRIRTLGEEPIKGISAPMAICAYRPAA